MLTFDPAVYSVFIDEISLLADILTFVPPVYSVFVFIDDISLLADILTLLPAVNIFCLVVSKFAISSFTSSILK